MHKRGGGSVGVTATCQNYDMVWPQTVNLEQIKKMGIQIQNLRGSDFSTQNLWGRSKFQYGGHCQITPANPPPQPYVMASQ